MFSQRNLFNDVAILIFLTPWIITSLCAFEECSISSLKTATEAFARIRGNGDEFCNTNPVDNGVAIEKEFPHIAIIEAKVEKVIGRFKILRIDTKCAGSLITKKVVVTVQTCVNSTRHLAANIKFGMLIFNETRSIKSIEISQNDMVSEKQLTVLKLPEEIEINEFIMPAKIPTSTFDTLIDEKVILSGWTGFRYECNQQMRKWFLRKMLFRSCGDNLMCLNELDIINYREMLVAGSPLQIYHPNNNCQYMLIAIFKEIRNGRYEFIDVTSEFNDNWIANQN